jgi:two-component system cell cycle sensor histidine kinase/response regulator CckA
LNAGKKLEEAAPAVLPARLRILHLEDNPADAELIHAALELEGVAIDARRVETREEFVSALAEGPYDIVLSDYALPSFDGIAAARELRRRDADLPMIVISGTLGEERAVEALKAGATDFLVKQHLNRVAPAVARALEEARERAALRQAELELEESRRFLQRMIDASPNLIFVFDLEERRNVYMNPQSISMLGYTPAQIQAFGSELPAQTTHPADLPRLNALWDRMKTARDGEVLENDYRIRSASGEWRWLRSRHVPFKREGGRVREILGAAQDVTEYKEAEQRRDAQQALTAALSESATWREAGRRVVQAMGSTLDWPLAEVWEVDRAAHVLRLAALWHDPALPAAPWVDISSTLAFPSGPSLLGRVWANGRTVWTEDLTQDAHFMRRDLAAELGIRCAVAAPIGDGREVTGVLLLLGPDARPADGALMSTLETFGNQIGSFRLRQAAEQALRDSEEKYRSIVETTAEWIWAANTLGQRTYSNPAVQEILGYAPDEVVGRDVAELLYPESAEWVHRELPVYVREKRGWKGVALKWRHRDGGARFLESDSVPMFDAEGAVSGFRGADRDVTARRDSEERIREQAALLEAAHEAILVESLEGRITYWNRGAERLYGVPLEAAMGRALSELVQAESVAEARDASHAVLETGEWSGQLSQRTRGGRDLVVQSHRTLVRDEGGRAKAVLVINTDVTEARRMEAKFLRTQRMESLGVLAGGVAHDLNNILAPILMAVDILRRKDMDDQSRRLITAVETSARRGADLVRQVLTFARGAEGTRAPLQPGHVLAEMERMVRETFPRSIEVKNEVAGDLWVVMGQSTPLQQVVMNLCVNARDAMGAGGVLTLRAQNVVLDDRGGPLHALAHPGPYVRLTVTDTGEGIPADVIEHIFDPFFTTKPVGRGTGLGLSTTMSIVNAHGGFMDVHSVPGEGSTFHVYLPALPSSVASREPGPDEEPAVGAGELVLLVDDEASIRQMAREVLEEFGFTVITADGGREALALFQERRSEVRVIVTDLAMPEMDGVSLIRALRKIDDKVAIVASSGVIEGAPLETGADALLAKPYTALQLVDLVRSLAQRG